MNSKIDALVEDMKRAILDAIDEAAMTKASEIVLEAFRAHPKKSVAKAAGKPAAPVVAAPAKRRKPPKQLCPSPRCKNAAAPIFGMLCAKHKDAPKATVAIWRENRRARKAT